MDIIVKQNLLMPKKDQLSGSSKHIDTWISMY